MWTTIAFAALMTSVVYCGNEHVGPEILSSHAGEIQGRGGRLHGLRDGSGENYAPQPYKFGYRVNEEWGQQHREEQADGQGNVVGSYGFTDAQGIYRQVNYVADKFGFRAQVKTNEPGTSSSNPANTHIDSSALLNIAQQGAAGGYGENDNGIKRS